MGATTLRGDTGATACQRTGRTATQQPRARHSLTHACAERTASARGSSTHRPPASARRARPAAWLRPAARAAAASAMGSHASIARRAARARYATSAKKAHLRKKSAIDARARSCGHLCASACARAMQTACVVGAWPPASVVRHAGGAHSPPKRPNFQSARRSRRRRRLRSRRDGSLHAGPGRGERGAAARLGRGACAPGCRQLGCARLSAGRRPPRAVAASHAPRARRRPRARLLPPRPRRRCAAIRAGCGAAARAGARSEFARPRVGTPPHTPLAATAGL